MSIVHIAAVCCDGCGRIHQAREDGPSSATQARREALLAGWQFPPKIKVDGSPGDSFSDVCPACAPGWAHRTAPNSWRPSTANRVYQAPDVDEAERREVERMTLSLMRYAKGRPHLLALVKATVERRTAQVQSSDGT